MMSARQTQTGHPLRRLVKRQNVTGLNFFLVEFLLPAEILFSETGQFLILTYQGVGQSWTMARKLRVSEWNIPVRFTT